MAIDFQPISNTGTIDFQPMQPAQDAPKEEWDQYYKSTIKPKTINSSNVYQEAVAPALEDIDFALGGAPKALAHHIGTDVIGLTPEQTDASLAQTFPEQQTDTGKLLRFTGAVPAAVLGPAAEAGMALAGKAGELSAAAGTIGSKIVPEIAKPATAILGSAVKGASEWTSAAFPWLASQATVDPEGAKKNAVTAAEMGAGAGTLGLATRAALPVVGKVGNAVQDMVLGKQVADRGRDVGFNNLLDVKYDDPSIPQWITDKATNLFKNASNVTGQAIKNIINSPKLKNEVVDTFDLQDKLNSILPKNTTLDDYDITGAQKKAFQSFLDDFNSLGKAPATGISSSARESILDQNKLSLNDLWEKRKQLDQMAQDTNFGTKSDAQMLLNKFRAVLNQPLRDNQAIATAFDKYAFVQRAKEELGGWDGVIDATGKKVYSPELEGFINQAMSGAAKNEKVNLYRDVEKYLPKDQQTMDDILNYSAGRSIRNPEGGIKPRGLVEKVAETALGGKEQVAKMSAGMQTGKGANVLNFITRAVAENHMSEDEAMDVLKQYRLRGMTAESSLGGGEGDLVDAIKAKENPNVAPRAGALKNRPEDFATADEYVASKGGVDDNIVNPKVYWHGSFSGDLRGGATGLHVGSKLAATQALEARIGIRADGKGWDGSQSYGDTLLAGKKNIRSEKYGKYKESGINTDVPENDFYAKDMPIEWQRKHLTFPDKTSMPFEMKPSVKAYKITGEMSNSPQRPHEDFKANGYMAANLKKGTAKRGYFYNNIGEDNSYPSAVLPNGKHLQELPTKSQLTAEWQKAKQGAETNAAAPSYAGKTDQWGTKLTSGDFGTDDAFVYHISDQPYHKINLRSYRTQGILPSSEDRGMSGGGVYMGNTPDATQYYASHQLGQGDTGTLFRINKKKLIEKFGQYSKDNPNGIQFDESNGEIILGGNRSVPRDFIDVRDSNGNWKKLGLLAPVAGATAVGLSQVDANAQEVDSPTEMTKKFEGFKDSSYTDTVGKKTIGYGFNLDDKNVRSIVSPYLKNGKISKEDADKVFPKLYNQAFSDAKDFVGDGWDNLNPKAQSIVADMSYNLGRNKLNGFDKFKTALQSGDYKEAANEMIDSKWYKQVGNRSKYLVKEMSKLARSNK